MLDIHTGVQLFDISECQSYIWYFKLKLQETSAIADFFLIAVIGELKIFYTTLEAQYGDYL